MVGRLVGWLVGWEAGRLVGRMVGWLVGRLVGWMVGWLAGGMVGRLVGWWVCWLVGWLVGGSFWLRELVSDTSFTCFLRSLRLGAVSIHSLAELDLLSTTSVELENICQGVAPLTRSCQ